MTTLAEVQPGDQFLFVCQVTALDPSTGISLSLYGPSSVKAADATIGIDGSMSGSLANTPDQLPVTIVTGFVPIAVGDVLQNLKTGETVVCRWSQLQPDGSMLWSTAPTGKVVYTASGWSIIAHIDGLE